MLEETRLDHAISSAITATKLTLCCVILKRRRRWCWWYQCCL